MTDPSGWYLAPAMIAGAGLWAALAWVARVFGFGIRILTLDVLDDYHVISG